MALLLLAAIGIAHPVLQVARANPSLLTAVARQPAAYSDEAFIGPFPSWADAVRDYGAKGDGIQDDSAALQSALDALARDARPSTLLLPAGNYRITRTLRLYHGAFVRIVGVSPDLVTLRWDGPAGGTMLEISNSVRIGLGRLRLDGASRAGTGLWLRWNRDKGEYFPTHFEIADAIFEDLAIGLRGGEDHARVGHQDSAAEVIVKRSRFLRSANAGVLVDDWNTVDWWIAECYFRDNAVSVRNVVGGTHVYHSVFVNSADTDVYASDVEYMSLRDNYSDGSTQFFATSGPRESGIALTLQRNTIARTRRTPISLGWAGPLVMLDNRIDYPGPAIEYFARVPGNLISVGNHYASEPYAHNLGADLRTRSINDDFVPGVLEAAPAPAPFAPQFHGPVREVAAFTGAAIQAAIIDADIQYRGQKPVVHLPAGIYVVGYTLTIPAGSDVRLVGDGFQMRSVLAPLPGIAGPTLRIEGPSHAQLVDLAVRGTAAGPAIEIRGADAPGARIYIEQAEVNPGTVRDIGIDADGIDFVAIESRYSMVGSQHIGMRIAGGLHTRDAYPPATLLSVFAGTYGSSGALGPNWLVEDGAGLLVQDHWFENNSARPATLEIHGGGTVTFHGGKQQARGAGDTSAPSLRLEGIPGRVTLLGIRAYGQRLLIEGANPLQDFLFLGGCLCVERTMASGLADRTSAGRTAVLYSAQMSDPLAPHALAQNTGPASDGFILDMLAQTRAGRWDSFVPVAPAAADIRLYRVGIDDATVGLRIH